jgi:protein-ribulosamine 3-kinase
MMRSQHESAAAINAVVPGFVPRPVAWETYESTEDLDDTQFYLCEFVALANDVINTTEDGKGLAKPDPVDFTAKVARLHTQSSAVLDEAVKEGFGFEYETYPGPLANFTGRREGWEAFFSWHLRRALREERLARDGEHDEGGTDEQLDDLGPYLFGAVIPRLLKPLESKGRTVTPALVHGDLWAGSVAREEKTGESVVLDAACWCPSQSRLRITTPGWICTKCEWTAGNESSWVGGGS